MQFDGMRSRNQSKDLGNKLHSGSTHLQIVHVDIEMHLKTLTS